jgi:hypothetical protein
MLKSLLVPLPPYGSAHCGSVATSPLMPVPLEPVAPLDPLGTVELDVEVPVLTS